VQVLQDTIVTPHVMGKIMGLSPAVILLSLSVWGYILGIVGLIIALPVTTLMISYYRRYVIGNEEVSAEESPQAPAEEEAQEPA
jgi:Predicted permease